MKKVFVTLFQFVVFLLTFAVGSFLPLLHVPSVISTWAQGTRSFQWDGVLSMLVLFLVILAVEAARKRLASAGPWTALAAVLATGAGLLMRLGFLTNVR